MKHSVTGVHLLRYLAVNGLKIFTVNQTKQAALTLKMNPGYVTESLHYLLKEKWVVRLKRGVYALSSDSGFGDPPHEFEVAMALVTPSAISHWTALHYHHLTQQTPNTIFVITPTHTSIPRSINRKSYRFVKIKESHYFGIEKVWIGQAQIQITTPERTLLDGLIAPKYCGDFQEVLHAFKTHRNRMDLKKIIQYALNLNQVIAKRLGWILEQLGVQDSQLKDLLRIPIKGYRRLDPSSPSKGIYHKKWMIQENIGTL
ncbi:MAG: type IV toxin-antitoxin system AbiEi family antitoxin [Chlamydiota bacterium]